MPSAQKIIDIIINVSTKKATAAFNNLKKGASSVGDGLNSIQSKGVDALKNQVNNVTGAFERWRQSQINNAKNLNQSINLSQKFGNSLDIIKQKTGLATEESQALQASIKAYNAVLDQGGGSSDARIAALAAAQNGFNGISTSKAEDLVKVTEDVSRTSKESARDVLNFAKGLKNLSFGGGIKALRGVFQLTKVFRSGLAGATISLSGLKAGAAGAAAALVAVSVAALASSRTLREAAQRTRISGNEFDLLRNQLEQTTVAAQSNDLQEAILNITERFGEAAKDSGAIRDSLVDLGTPLSEIIDISSSGPAEQLEKFRELIQGAENDSVAFFKVRELLAEDGARILPFLELSDAQIKLNNARREFLRIGDNNVSTENLNELQFAFLEFQAIIRDTIETIASKFAPTVSRMTRIFSTALAPSIQLVGAVLSPFIDAALYLFNIVLSGVEKVGKLVNVFREFVLWIRDGASALADFGQIDLFKNILVKTEEFRFKVSSTITDLGADFDRLYAKITRSGPEDVLNQLVKAQDELAKRRDNLYSGGGGFENDREELLQIQGFISEASSLASDADKLDAYSLFLETGQTVEEAKKYRETLSSIELKYIKLSESAAKVAPDFGSSSDTSKLDQLQQKAIQASKELAAFEESRVKSAKQLAALTLKGQLTDEVFLQKVETITKAKIALQEAEVRAANAVRIAELDKQFIQDNAFNKALGQFDEERAIRAKYEEDILKIKKDGIKNLSEAEINQVIARRAEYFNNVELIKKKNSDLLKELKSNDFSQIISLSFDGELDVNNAITSVVEQVNSKLEEIDQNLFDRIIDQQQASDLRARANALGDEIKREAASQVERNRAELRKDALTLEEVVGLDFYEADNYKDAINELTDAMENQKATILQARLNDVISDEQASEANKNLLASEQRKLAQIKEATDFASSQRAFDAISIDDFVSFDAGDSTKIKDVLNDINVAFREEKIEILKAAEAGDISETEKTQAINKLAAAKIEVDERAQALVARNTIRSVEDLGDLSSLLNFDTETTVKDLDNDLRGIKRAAEDSITDIEKFLIDNPQLDAEYEAFLRGVIGNIPAIQARVSDDLKESAEYSKLKDALSGQSLFKDISGENIGLNSGGLADTLLTAGNIYRDAITDTFSLINDEGSFAFAFPSLDIDFTSVNSIREGVSQVAAAFQEEKDRIVEVVNNDTDFNSTQESINKEVERRTRALERYRDNLIEIKLPIIFTLTKSADFLDDVNGLLGSVNTIQQNEIANLESGIKSRADDIKSTQDRLREAIEAGDINEVKSYQQKLNGLTSLQKKEDALAKKKFEANKKTQRAMAIVNAFAGAARALTLPFPQNLLAFASTLATGKAAVDAIDRTEYQSASGLDVGGGSLSGGDLSNNTDLNSLSGTLTAEQLIERGLDDDRGDTRRRQVITVDLPDDRIITTRMAIELYNEILEQAGDGQIAAIQAL